MLVGPLSSFYSTTSCLSQQLCTPSVTADLHGERVDIITFVIKTWCTEQDVNQQLITKHP